MTSSSRSKQLRSLLTLGGMLLTLYGCLGLLFDLHLPQRLHQAVLAWRGLFQGANPAGWETLPPWDPPGWLAALGDHFDRAVLLVWLAWGLGILLLLVAAGRRLGPASLPRAPFAWRDGLALLLLAVILAGAYFLRARFLLPLSGGPIPASNYDEMVYLEAARLWTRGIPPYSSFFLAHPPGILMALAPAVLFAEPWGGPALLLAGRWLQFAGGLVAVALLYAVGRQVGGRSAGLLAALVLAVDIQAVQVAPLETVVNLATVGGLWLYLAALRCTARWARYALLFLAGAAAALAALTKAPGVVSLLLLAGLALLAWQWRELLAGLSGVVATGLAAGLVFALRAPGAFVRQVIAFQLLRPQETAYARNHLARMAEYPESRLTFVLLLAAVVLLTAVATSDAWREVRAGSGRRTAAGPRGWVAPVVLVVVLLLFLFSFGRAYHSRYYVQLVVPLALLVAAGVGAIAPLVRDWTLQGRAIAALLSLVFLLLLLPQVGQQILTLNQVEHDRAYGVVGQALRDTVPQGRAVMALDPGYALMADRPPASLPGGTYVVDGAGLMAYQALGIAEMKPGQVWEAARRTTRDIDPQAVFHQPAAQDLVVSALYGGGGDLAPAAAVLDMRIAAEDLTPQTQEFLRTRGRQVAWEQYTAAFTVERVNLLAQSSSGLALWDFNMRPLTSQGEGPAAQPGAALEVSAGDVLQVSLYWFVAQAPTATLLVALELRDAAGAAVARLREAPHFGDPPPNLWRAHWVYQDHHNLPLSDPTPGDYTLYVALLDGTAQPWPWRAGGQPDGAMPLGVVRVQP